MDTVFRRHPHGLRISQKSFLTLTQPLQVFRFRMSGFGSEAHMQGYLGDAEKTKHVRRGKWLRTGDLAYWDNDGMLYIQGRKDDMVIRAGMNIYPAEIENVLSSDERVRDVLAYGYEKDGTQQIGLKISGAFSTVEEVMTLCRSLLPNFQIPSQIELVDENKVFLGGKKRRKNTQ